MAEERSRQMKSIQGATGDVEERRKLSKDLSNDPSANQTCVVPSVEELFLVDAGKVLAALQILRAGSKSKAGLLSQKQLERKSLFNGKKGKGDGRRREEMRTKRGLWEEALGFTCDPNG